MLYQESELSVDLLQENQDLVKNQIPLTNIFDANKKLNVAYSSWTDTKDVKDE